MSKPNITLVVGFRNDCDDFFKYEIKSRGHLKHTTPFIFYLNGCVEALYYTKDLMQKCCDDDIILKAWEGRWKTDIFAFRFGDLKEFIEKNEVRII
jgi:hypothetical protein